MHKLRNDPWFEESLFLRRNMVLITYGLLAADSESQYITFPFYADCESGTDMQWPVLPHNDYKINVYSSCHGLKSHHLLSAVDLNYLNDLR